MERKSKARMGWGPIWLVFFLSIPVWVQAQGRATGAMSGTVQDSSGAVIPSATVTIVNTATGETIRAESTNASGFNCGNAFTHGSVSSRLGGYLNRAAFLNDEPLDQQIGNPLGVADPTATGFGDVPRNCFYGPRQLDVDFSLGKVFPITERQSLKLSVEFFNLTNTTSFANRRPRTTSSTLTASLPPARCSGPSRRLWVHPD